MITWDQIDWAALESMRDGFLRSVPGSPSYWKSDRDLASYDLTFAERIGWKWDAVFRELARQEWSPPSGWIVDWGCGSGIAHRRLLVSYPAATFSGLACHDCSALAIRYSLARLSENFPKITGRSLADLPSNEPIAVLVMSHVLNELSPTARLEIESLLDRSETVLWVEPGTSSVSRALVGFRERFRNRFRLVAPCPHQGECGLNSPDCLGDWCHFFAQAPTEAFSEARWHEFSERLGIDLRSLPFSYLVMDRRPNSSAMLPPDSIRFLGRGKVFKPYARIIGCDSAGVKEREISKRHAKERFRMIKNEVEYPLQKSSDPKELESSA